MSYPSLAERLVELLPPGTCRRLVDRIEETQRRVRRRRRGEDLTVTIEFGEDGQIEAVDLPHRIVRERAG